MQAQMMAQVGREGKPLPLPVALRGDAR